MKILISNKNINKNNKGGKGFTLIELLAIIIVLALIISIVSIVIVGVINDSKEKGYKVTINNVERVAGNYVSEYRHKMFWIDTVAGDNSKVFQCIKVQNLIDAGYFKSDLLNSEVSKSRNINASDYIYIEMDNISKVVTKNKLIYNSSQDELNNICMDVNNKAFIRVSFPDGWAKEKNVNIEYMLLVDEGIKKQYQYNYSVNNNSDIKGENIDFSELIEEKKIKVNKNGIVYASIVKKDGTERVDKEINVTGIDNEGPVVTSSYSGNQVVRGSVTIPLNLRDDGIGVNVDSFTIDDVVVMIGDVELKEGLELVKVNDNNYNLIINNRVYSGKVKVNIADNKVFDKLENGNNDIELSLDLEFGRMVYQVKYYANGGSKAPDSQEKLYGTDLILSSDKPTRSNYNFLGWSTDSAATSATYRPGDVYTTNDDLFLHAVWEEIKCTLPIFHYTGSYELVKDDDTLIKSGKNSTVVIPKKYQNYTGNWKIRFLTTGDLTFYDLRGAKNGIDAFLVGGGGGGGDWNWQRENAGGHKNYIGGGGGGGGRTNTVKGIDVTVDLLYPIYIGAGGPFGGGGETTTAFNKSANGGNPGSGRSGGSGGSGGGAGGCDNDVNAGGGGSNGGNGGVVSPYEGGCSCSAGSGYDKKTSEFWESGGTLYAGGGGGGAGMDDDYVKCSGYSSGGSGGGGTGGACKSDGAAGSANTGGGGGGAGGDAAGGAGGSGIVIIRNKR